MRASLPSYTNIRSLKRLHNGAMDFEGEPVYRHRQRPDIPLEADTLVGSDRSLSGGEESKKRKIGGFTRTPSVSERWMLS